ncbi:GSCFA domain-containing protein [Flavobacterium sp.]|uniref:GSCFA domain-containing protein n=1 Tax=Flavobacterium sp. TaxID=239 RepID=UPI003342A038
MNFTTKVPIAKSNSPIDYSSQIVAMGSCFAENMGEKFDFYKFQNTTNPFGIIFNPVSIEKILERAIHLNYFTETDLFFYNELWHCYEVHSDLSQPNKEAMLSNLNRLLTEMNSKLAAATHLFITYGTSWVYQLKSTGVVVANCHKVAQDQFEKVILSVTEIENAIQNSIDLIQKINPKCQLVFTVSPVRHIKDGFVENQRSKANLISALHTSISQQPTSSYFPSYEIVMDELRDYRFYAQDLLHPNAVAIDYIWECFCETNITEAAQKVMQEVESIQKGMAHRPFHPDLKSHSKFLQKLKEKSAHLEAQFPFMKF